MLRPSIALALLSLTLAVGAADAFAGWRVGNGDELRLAFSMAKEHAAHITLRLNAPSLPADTRADVRSFLLSNHEALAGDVAGAKHYWDYETDGDTGCAQSERTDQPATGAVVTFYYKKCRVDAPSYGSFDGAGRLLIHESVHHFQAAIRALGIDTATEEELFADDVAKAVYSAWRSGGLDWLSTRADASAPEARTRASAVWTGSQVIVYGGAALDNTQRQPLGNGYSYDPATDSWAPLKVGRGTPPKRYGHIALWLGDKMLVWGGFTVRTNGTSYASEWQNSGALYDPQTGDWTELHAKFGPATIAKLPQVIDMPYQTAVWTGQDVIIYGGAPDASGVLPGGVYTPSTNTWASAPLPSLNAPDGVEAHTAVWADDRMIVFGGIDADGNASADGAAYQGGRWTKLPSRNATARFGHTAAWTGAQMVVFGGTEPNTTAGTGAGLRGYLASAGVYSPASGWTAVRSDTFGLPRTGHTMIWDGSEVLVFGGSTQKVGIPFGSVLAYNPQSASWRVVETRGSAALARSTHAAVWTGAGMVVFGGVTGMGSVERQVLSTGGIFFP
jgi:N-acetylneuraminic acid mutarotase